MLRQVRRHGFYFGSLLIIESLCLVLVLFSQGNIQMQMTGIILAAASYILWGIIHHKVHHDLHPKIVVEYVLMGSLGIAIIYFLLQ